MHEIKDLVREKYSEIALQSRETNLNSCCGCGPGGTYTIMSDAYEGMEGYNPDADLGLGCGLPTQFAQIQAGDTVLDLGSGAGNDCFVARAETGPTGKVIGVDFSATMLQKARMNADKLGYNNVEFREGDIEHLPVLDESVDVVVSNCVLNLVPNKKQVFQEIKRVLKPGAHFSISDIVLEGELPAGIQNAAEMYAGCVAGAIQKTDYLNIIKEAGFENITVQKQKTILIPDEILLEYISQDDIKAFVEAQNGIYSVTVYAEKPGEKRTFKPLQMTAKADACCGPDCCS